MVDPMASSIGTKIVEYLLSKCFSKAINAFGNEVQRIHKLLEANTLADLRAAIDLTCKAVTLQNPGNRTFHLNAAIPEYTKAVERLKNHKNSTLDIAMARFGMALSYYMLDEPTICAAELEQLEEDVQHFHEAIKETLCEVERNLMKASWAGLESVWLTHGLIVIISNGSYLPVAKMILSEVGFKPTDRLFWEPLAQIPIVRKAESNLNAVIAKIPIVGKAQSTLYDAIVKARARVPVESFVLLRKKEWVVPWEEIHALRNAAAMIKDGLTTRRR